MVGTTLTVNLDSRPAIAGLRQLGRSLAESRQDLGRYDADFNHMTALVAGARNTLARFASDGHRVRTTLDGMSRATSDAGRAFARTAGEFVRGAEAIARATNAVARSSSGVVGSGQIVRTMAGSSAGFGGQEAIARTTGAMMARPSGDFGGYGAIVHAVARPDPNS